MILALGFYHDEDDAIWEARMMQCLMDHIVLNVEDEEKMIAFY